MTRVLVVDDSPSVRELLVHILESDPDIKVIGCAVDGDEAVQMATELRPDVITMDLQMPNVDGFEATRRIMQTCATPIVIVSGGSEDNAERRDASFRAIEAGALVLARRPAGPGHPSYRSGADELIRIVKSMAEVKVVRRWPREERRSVTRGGVLPETVGRPARRLVLIGASTGGPAVLREILEQLSPPFRFSFPVLIVQHMASGFIGAFRDWLGAATRLPVSTAIQGEQLMGGRIYLAPDGFQVSVGFDLRVALMEAPPEHGMCPSVSHLFRELDPALCRSTVAVLLTGMGKDGGAGLKRLKENGALTLVQDRASAVVYGMPGEAIRLEAAMHVLTPTEIGRTLYRLAQEGSRG